MNPAHRIVSWLGRIVLLATSVIFVLIGLRYLTNPVGAAAEFHIALGSAAGATSLRVGSGAFPLAFAATLLVCLASSRRRLFGLGMVAAVMGLATGARLLGLVVDGPAAESSRLLAPEIVLAALSLFCVGFERNARRSATAIEPEETERSIRRSPSAFERLRGGIGVTFLLGVALVLTASAIAKLAGVPAVASQLGALGFARLLPLVGTLELTGAALVAFPLTRPAGLLMTSAFLGGAIATHLQHGLSPVNPAVPLALLWLGAWLRHPELAAVARRGRGALTAIPVERPARERASA